MQDMKLDEVWFNAGVAAVMDVTQQEQRTPDGRTVLGPKVNADGVPLWRVEVAFKGEGMRRSEIVMVTVASPTVPELIGRTPVFGGVRGRPWLIEGKAGVAVSAASFSTVDARPSSKTPQVPVDAVNGSKS